MTTVGDAHDYRYFLPRILQLALEDPTWVGVEPPLLVWRIKKAGWTEFSDQQARAIHSVFKAGFQIAVEKHPDEADETLAWWCALGSLGINPKLVFEWITSDHGTNAALQLANIVTASAAHIERHGHIDPPFGEDYTDVSTLQAITEFLLSENVKERLLTALESSTPEDTLTFLEPALKHIDHLNE